MQPLTISDWKNPALYLKIIALVLTALYAGNVLPTGSEAAKIVAMAITVLGALGYGAVQASLKKAYMRHIVEMATAAPANTNAPAATARVAQAGFSSAGLMAMIAVVMTIATVSFVMASSPGCAWGKKEAKVVENAALDCGKGEYSKLLPIAAAFAEGIISGSSSWDQAGKAAISAGEDWGGCFLADIADQVKASAGSGSGSGAKASAPGADLALQRFREATGSKLSYKATSGASY